MHTGEDGKARNEDDAADGLTHGRLHRVDGAGAYKRPAQASPCDREEVADENAPEQPVVCLLLPRCSGPGCLSGSSRACAGFEGLLLDAAVKPCDHNHYK